MRKITNCLAGACALWGISAAPASAVMVRFDVKEIGTLVASEVFPLLVADFEGFLLFEFVDTDDDGMPDIGTLLDLRLKAFGPVVDVISAPPNGMPGDVLTLELLPGQVELLQIPDGTEFQYPDPDSTPEQPIFVSGIAKNPVGTLEPILETPGVNRFTFDAGPLPGPEDDEFLAVQGAPDTGVLACVFGEGCGPAEGILGGFPLDLSGPQAPLAVADAVGGVKLVFFDIVGLDTIESTPASLTGSFSFFLGAFPVEFDILSATGTVVPEPGAGLGAAASLGTLALLGRRRRAARGGDRSARRS